MHLCKKYQQSEVLLFWRTSWDVPPRLWLLPFGIVTFCKASKWILTRYVTRTFAQLLSTCSVDITHTSYSRYLILNERFLTRVRSRLNGALLCQYMKKIHNDQQNLPNHLLNSVLTTAFTKIDSILHFPQFWKRYVILKSLSFLNALSYKDGIGPKW